MNTRKLLRSYDELSARERALLMVAAAAREDKTELESLAGLASSYRVRSYVGPLYALCALAQYHQLRQLDLAASLFMALAAPREWDPSPENAIRLASCLLLTHDAAWSRFCSEQGLALRQASILPGVESASLPLAYKIASTIESDPESLRAALAGDMGESADLVTVESAARDYPDLYSKWTEGWK